jgi:crotonobetainyl-CoA:carnitine CoA-transferase CaiB-like acyl-CoA transferase
MVDAGSGGALAGLRVLDLTSRKGGYCGRLLSNLGADVVLVEHPGGDPMRREGPFKNGMPHPEGSLSFASYHTGKRGIVLDLEQPPDRDTLRDLARGSDALIEDLPPGSLQRLGLGYQDLRAINSALVMTSITGFGQSGPYRDFKDPHIVVFAMGEQMYVCGDLGRAPLTGPCDIGFQLGSVHAAFGTLVALYNRAGSGRGQHVEVSHQEVSVADPFLRLITRYSVTGQIELRSGARLNANLANTYPCQDGYVHLVVLQTDQWRRLVEWLGNPPELMDPALDIAQNRVAAQDRVHRLVEARARTYKKDALFSELQSYRLSASAIHSPSEFLNDRQTEHRKYVYEVDHSYMGRHPFPGDPYIT